MTTAQQNRLASAFKFDAIGFLSVNHPNPEYSWMSRALDVKLRKMKIPIAEMESDAGYFTDATKKDEMDEDIIEKIETKLSKLLFANPRIKVKNQQACDDFVKMVDLMYKVKSGTLHSLEDRSSFNRAYANYAAENRAPEEAEAMDEFIIFLDISQLHLDGFIDFNDLSKVLDVPPPFTQSVQFVAGGKRQRDNVAVTAVDMTSADVVEAFSKMSIEFFKFYLHERERKIEAEESEEDEDEDSERERKLKAKEYEEDEDEDNDKDIEEGRKKMDYCNDYYDNDNDKKILLQEHFKTNRGEAILSNSMFTKRHQRLWEDDTILSNSMFTKRHQRLREDDTNSTNTNSTTTNSMYTNSNWKKVKAGVNGEPSEPRYELGTTIYVDIKGTEYKGTVVGWDPIELL